MRLVDTALPFHIVYSIYHHEYLGFLISSHIVQLLPNGERSLISQGIYADNMNQFSSALSEEDNSLVRLMSELRPKSIVKQFGGNPRDLAQFFTKKFEGKVRLLIQDYIQRRMSKIFPLLEGKEIFIMAKDGYPAHQPVKVLGEKATVLFHFRKKENATFYFPTIKLFGAKIDFQFKKASLLCYDPAWMLLDNNLFSFEGNVDGKKLKPFLNKRSIMIPKDKEEEYYRKFVTQLVERYHVYAKGFEIRTIRERPSFCIEVKDFQNSMGFEPKVIYGDYHLSLDPHNRIRATLDKTEQGYVFNRISRDQLAEAQVESLLKEHLPNPNSITPWECLTRDDGLIWLSEKAALLEDHGIKILQPNPERKINLHKPEISIETQEAGDWFDIKSVVKIGEFTIPFIKFRNHILKNIREYILPDGSIAILPENWFTDFRHLLEVSETSDDDTLRIKKYQAPLLFIPAMQGPWKEKVDSIKQLEGVPELAPPKNLKATLRNYQARGYDWLRFLQSNKMGGILADDMGLGKTIQAISLLLSEKEAERNMPSLAILPTSLIFNWKNEAEKFAPDLKLCIHTGVSRGKNLEKFGEFDLVLSTYGIVRQDVDLLKDYPFNYIILDESQMIKNPASKTAKAIRKLTAMNRLSLTGTPVENTVMDVWSQMAFLNPGLLGSEAFFKKYYVTPIEKEQNEDRSQELRKILHPFILRRKKEQVETELPPKIEKLHYCEMDELQAELYEETRNTYRNYLMELINNGTLKKNKLNLLAGLQKMRQIAIHPRLVEPDNFDLSHSGKYLETKRLLNEILRKKSSKVLIFSQFVKMLQLLRSDLDDMGVSYNYLDGSTKNRQEQVDTFQEDPSIKVFLISLKAGGVGLNLTAADYVFILDPWWNPAAENQAIDRSHRIGQKRTVFYYKFITKDSIEEKILKLQYRKAKLSNDIISAEADIYKSLNAEDLGELVS